MAEDAPKPKQLWGDVEDDPPSSSSTPAVDLPVESLTIHDEAKEAESLDEPEDSSIQAVTSGDTPYTSASTFEDLNLSPELLRGIYSEMKFERPSKIQAISLPMILTPPYKNLIAQAHNGSGKTTCFVLGMLSRVDPKLQVPQALCICPTRELAIQNLEVLRKMGKHTGIESECAIPMDSANYTSISQRQPVKAQVVIGTPGTVKKWMSHRKLGISNMRILVFDEADHMLAEDGFKDDSLRIMKDIERSGAQCQVLLFSATFNDTVKNFVTRIVKDYNQMFVKKEELSLQSVKQYKVKCPDELSKILVIKEKIFELGQKLGQTIIFVRTKNSAGMLHKALVDFGYEVTTIQGALRQEDRDKIIKEFKDGLTQVLISTDLLARGFDQSRVNLVVNYDLPLKYGTQAEPDYEVYLHRIGRAGRFGRKGAVFNLLCSDKDNILMSKIENHFGVQIAEVTSGDTPYASASNFEDLNLSPELLRGIYIEMKFERPSKIQAISLPMILTPPYKNLIAQAHNGSGKTACFVLGMLSRVDPKLQVPQALCICPTRELAIQNLEVLRKMGKHTGIESECAIPMRTSISQLPVVKAQVVIGTPCIVKRWMSHKKLGISNLKILVFDEVDHMFAEDGFKDDSLRIMKYIERSGAQCQVLLFSATFKIKVRNFVTRIVKDYKKMFVEKEEPSLQSVKQYKVKCPDDRSKIFVIKDKIFELGQKLGQTIIFVKTKNNAGMLHKALVDFGYEVTTIQGALRQEDRDKIIKEFKDGLTQVLISTDLLARGFDQPRVNLVINYDLPLKHGTQAEPDYEMYLHRIGRAGRFGRKGAVFNLLCSDKDNILILKIENHFGVQIAEIPSWQNDDDFEAAMKDAGLC